MKDFEKRNLYESLCHINEKESSEEEDIISVQDPFESPSFIEDKEKSQRGDLMFDMLGMSESNTPSENISKDPFSEDSFIEAKNEHDILDDNERIDYITDILEESNISLIINNNKDNIIKFGKIKYKNRETTYEKLINPSKEEQKLQFEYNKSSNKYKKLKRFLNKIEEKTREYFSKINLGKELLIEIKIKEDNIDKTKIIISEYFIDDEFLKDKKLYQDKYILKGDNTLAGFTSFLEEIKQKQESINLTSTKEASINKQNNNYLSLIKVITKHKKYAQKIWELYDGSLISDGEIQFKIEYINQTGKNEPNNYDYSVNNKKKINISFENENISLSKKANDKLPNIEELYPCKNLLISKRGNYIIDGGTIYYASDIFIQSNKEKKFYTLSKKAYIGGIILNDDYITFMSNSTQTEGENKLVFLNSKSQKFLTELDIGISSAPFSENNFSIMRIPKYENIKLLLVACKNYNRSQNGILLIILQFNKDDINEKYQKFYDFKNFEVYCFCPLLENKNFTNNEQKIETEYFLVGGFDLIKKQGLIKLYKVEIEKKEIEFIQDITLEKTKENNGLEQFEGFKEPINSIIQSQQGEILVTCSNENGYIFSEPNFKKMRKN
jgi:hypothetical protein